MIDETDGVQHARRETWAKALAAVHSTLATWQSVFATEVVADVERSVVRAARADGVAIGEETDR